MLLDSYGKYTRLGDAQRIKHWVETGEGAHPALGTETAGAAARSRGRRARSRLQGLFAARAPKSPPEGGPVAPESPGGAIAALEQTSQAEVRRSAAMGS